jgi:hypothetical protein
MGCSALVSVYFLPQSDVLNRRHLAVGIIYRMNPFLMPRSFCLGMYGLKVSLQGWSYNRTLFEAQSILMSVGTFIETGVILALSLATGVTVQKPKTWGDAQRYVLPKFK